ncbi:MAG: SEC-C domain-containing protein [Chloroflexi bacterium]|nr:SEC-C domain-containing protein [Chloroflexota bacterium]
MDDLELYEQFKDLNLRFPKLSLEKDGDSLWSVRGDLRFSATFSGRQIDDLYSIKITIPKKYPDVLPEVQEASNRIPGDFHHYQDDSLCLGAPIAVRYKFKKDPTLAGFVCNCLIPYLYSFSYKIRFGRMPFGELSHGTLGILEYYGNLFDMKDRRRIVRMIQILAEDNYREHDRCPCGSGKRLHACHGKVLRELMTLQSPVEFNSEHNLIIRYLVKTAIQGPYSSLFRRGR